jgi:hypothetical protein
MLRVIAVDFPRGDIEQIDFAGSAKHWADAPDEVVQLRRRDKVLVGHNHADVLGAREVAEISSAGRPCSERLRTIGANAK